jgi:hypothetical protein
MQSGNSTVPLSRLEPGQYSARTSYSRLYHGFVSNVSIISRSQEQKVPPIVDDDDVLRLVGHGVLGGNPAGGDRLQFYN